MRGKVKELMEQAGTDSSGKWMSVENAEKFAELIVQECIDIVGAGGEFASRPKLVEKLQEHFGVEE